MRIYIYIFLNFPSFYVLTMAESITIKVVAKLPTKDYKYNITERQIDQETNI